MELALKEYMSEPTLSWYLDEWANTNYPIRKDDEEKWKALPEAQRHKISVALSRIEVIKKVEIEIPEADKKDAPVIFQALIKKKFSTRRLFGFFKPTEITSKIALEYVRERKKKVSAATTKRDVSALRSFFNTLEDIDAALAAKITGNPFESASIRVLLKGAEKRRAVRLSEFGEDAEERLIDALKSCRNPDMVRIIGLALSTGMRRGEILALRWWQIKEKYIQLEASGTKSEKDRRIFLPEESHAIIGGMERGEPQARLFKYTRNGFKSNWNRARLRAGLKTDTEALRVHDLRHEFISRMLEVIASPTALAAVVGGASVEHIRQQHIEPEKARIASESGIADEDGLRSGVGHEGERMTGHYATQIALTVAENAHKARKQAAGYPVVIETADGKTAAFCPDFGISKGADTEAEALEMLRRDIAERLRHDAPPTPSSPLKIARDFSGASVKLLLIG
jgi:integrase